MNDLDIDKAFILMHESVTKNIENSIIKDWIVKTII